jgi:hypothetical protein
MGLFLIALALVGGVLVIALLLGRTRRSGAGSDTYGSSDSSSPAFYSNASDSGRSSAWGGSNRSGGDWSDSHGDSGSSSDGGGGDGGGGGGGE